MGSEVRSAIEKIAKDGDRKRAVVFFLFFARFEYALKQARFVRRNGNRAEADWTRYAEHCAPLLDNNIQPRFQRAVEYLRNNPPKKQIVSGSRLEWTDDSLSGAWDVDRLLTLVRRVRNNLFHGGKSLVGHPEEAISRDAKLLNAALAVLEACLDWDSNLRSLFLEELDHT